MTLSAPSAYGSKLDSETSSYGLENVLDCFVDSGSLIAGRATLATAAGYSVGFFISGLDAGADTASVTAGDSNQVVHV